MDRRTYKSKPQHLVTDPRTGEIKSIVHSSDTSIGTAGIPSNLTVYGSVQANSLVDASGINYVDQTSFGLRLTLISNEPVSVTSVASAATLYLTPHTSGRASVYDGTNWINLNVSEVSLALSGMTTSKNYDVFLYLNGSSPALELSAAWTSDTARSDSLTRQDGVLVKSANKTRRYVGTIRAISATTVADSTTQRYVWNYYNRVPKMLTVTDTTASWTWATTNTWRQVRATSTNRVEYVSGDTTSVECAALGLVQCTVASHVRVGIGIDSTTADSCQLNLGHLYTAGAINVATAQYRGQIGLGYHALNWIEFTQFATATFYGYDALLRNPGLAGTVMC
jgi:hypothetical protein